ncbi:protein ANTI-SILENCING 1-like isoform X2 [Actinidia eriantha]|uniref:protein ANTI-SILENCING 1-like isoform X2 n=1 Tax=Actinidia eriantha TaxID=165200 RepID=UPI002587AEC7|nr:protein ANTI-SILENCING 1-like isoform X2 [Actinidia eriantha]
MLPLEEATEENNIEFSWGQKIGVGGPNNDVQFYASFTYDGVEYFLYDCVYMWHGKEPEPSIGKIVKIWEKANHKRVVKIVWFFRPIEIRPWLGEVEILENELFLASGEGKGLSNLNCLEAISGKYNIVCTSKDKRNPQASEEELRMADYIFYRTFDVGKCKISRIFEDVIAGIEVKHYFNREKDQKLFLSEFGANSKEKMANPRSCLKVEGITVVGNPVKDGKLDVSVKTLAKDKPKMKHSDNMSPTKLSDIRPWKKRKVQFSTVSSEKDPAKLSDSLPRVPDLRVKSISAPDSVTENLKLSNGLEQDRNNNTGSQYLKVTRKPIEDTSKWFKQQPWVDKMKRAHEKGTLVLLENLDPSYASSEVEDIIQHAFKENVEANMVQRCTFSSPHHGQAFVIFKSKDAAELAISELNRKCLMLSNGRPLVGCKGSPEEPSDPTKFVGHIDIIDKTRFHKQRVEMKDAVSTSHYSQPNTIEYEMAFYWLALQEKSNRWWDALYKKQAEEIDKFMCRLKRQETA